MPHNNLNAIDKKNLKTTHDVRKNNDVIRKSLEKNSKIKNCKKESIEHKPYVRVRVIDPRKENPKEKLDKASLYLEIMYGCEGNSDFKAQMIPLVTQVSYSGKEVRFDGVAISNIMGKFDSSSVTVLSGSTHKANGAKLGSNVSVHVPTKTGDFYFELTPDGNVKLNKLPVNLDVDLSTFATVETNRDLQCRKLKISAKEYTNNHHVSAKTIEITAGDKINNAAVMTADVVALQTIDAVSGAINNLQGKIESKVHMDLNSANIHNAAKLCAKQGDIKIQRNILFDNTRNGEFSAQTKIEGIMRNLNNAGKISADQVKLSIMENFKNFSVGKISVTQMIDLIAKELINGGEMISEGAIKCQAATITQDTVNATMASKTKLELIAAVLIRNSGLLLGKDLHVASVNGTIENVFNAKMKSDGSAVLNAATVRNTGEVLISEKLEIIARLLVENAGMLSAKDLQVISANGLVYNLEKAFMLGDKTTITSATVHNEGDILAKKGILKIVATFLLDNNKSAKLLGNDLLDIDAVKLMNKGLIASANKTYVEIKTLLDNQGSGVITAEAQVVELCINYSEKANHELLKQILAGRQKYGKDVELRAGLSIQNAGKLSGGPVTLTNTSTTGCIKIFENASILSRTDITLIAKNIENAGDLYCINGNVYSSSQLGKIDEKTRWEKNNKESQDSKESGELTVASKIEALLPVNPGEPGAIFKNNRNGKIIAKNGRIEIATSKLLNEGSMAADNQVIFNGQKFSHIKGQISAGNHVVINAINIKALSDINSGDNIVLQHGGGLWKVADKLHAKGTVHFIWPEARAVTQAFTLQGGIHYEILPTAKQSMQFLVNQLVNGDFSITIPTGLTIGNDQFYVLVGADQEHACQKMTITAKDIYLYNGRMASVKNMKLICHNLALGRYAGILHKPSSITCGEDIDFDIANNIGWHYLEMFGLKNLSVKAKNLDNISSTVIIEGDALFNTPSQHRLLVTSNSGTGQIQNQNDKNAMVAYKIMHEQHYAITKPAHFEVGGKLNNLKPMMIFASHVHCGMFEGIKPAELTFIAYQLWKSWHLYGNPKRRIWWREYLHNIVTAHIPGKVSVAGILKAMGGALTISGNVTAGNVELLGITQGHIGLKSNFALPDPKAFNPCIPLLKKENTSLFEITGAGMFATVYRPILPFQYNNAFGPILIIGANNHLRPNVNNYRCLYSAIQERRCYTRALMDELSRGFLTPQMADPYAALKTLRENAEHLYRNGNTYLSQNGTIPFPAIAYKEIEFIHARGEREMVLIPILYLPNTFNNPRLRDSSGGLFSFGNILIQGENYRDSTLKITGHIDARGKITFSTFNEISHTKRMVKNLYYVTDTTETKSIGGMSHKTKHTQRTLEAWQAAPGNTVTGAEIVYENIYHVKLEGAILTAGPGGVRTDNVGIFEQRALLEDQLKTDVDSLKMIMNATIWTTYQLEPTLTPTHIYSAGPVALKSYTGFYDNLYINHNRVSVQNPQIIATELTIGATEKYLEEQRISAEVKRLEDRRTARRKEAQSMGKTIVISAASAGTAAYIGGLLATTSTFAKGTLALAAAKGAIAGGTSAALTRKNILKGAASGALLAGVGFQLGKYLEGVESLKNAEKMRERIQLLAKAGLSTAIHKTNIIDSLLDIAAADLMGNLLPASAEGPIVNEIGKALLRSAVAGAGVAMVTGKDPMSAAGNALLQSAGEGLGSYIGEKTAQWQMNRYNNSLVDRKSSQDAKEGIEKHKMNKNAVNNKASTHPKSQGPIKNFNIVQPQMGENYEILKRRRINFVMQEIKKLLPKGTPINGERLRAIVESQVTERFSRGDLATLGKNLYNRDLEFKMYVDLYNQKRYNTSSVQPVNFIVATNYLITGVMALSMIALRLYQDPKHNLNSYHFEPDFESEEQERLDREFRNSPLNPEIGYYCVFRKPKVPQETPPKAERPNAPDRDKKYIPVPKGEWPGFPDAKPRKAMTPYGDGKKRERRELPDGRILEWDYRHGEVEMYDSKGKKHLGSFDHATGKQLKPGKPGRNIEKYL